MLMPELLDTALDIFLDAFKDTLTLIPFLYLTYLAMEALEHSAAAFSERVVVKAGKAGPILGGLLGAMPQCGFSAMAAALYSGRVITMGTVIAVFLSTSDEMLPVFISEGAPIELILAIIGSKVIIGMAAGLLIDLCIRLCKGNRREKLRIHELCEQDQCDCDTIDDKTNNDSSLASREVHECACGSEEGTDNHAAEHAGNTCCCHGHGHSHGHGHAHGHGHGSVWKSALIHTVQVTVFIFIISLILDSIITLVGEDALAAFMNQNALASIFASGLVGLIPNCAASVAISDLYLQGALGMPAMMAGLLVGAGVGLLVLFRANRPLKNTILVTCLLYAIGVSVGLLMYVFGIAL